MSGFVHLHCHSSWSLLDGALPVEALAHLAADLGFEAVALTDHDALTGAVRFTKACRDAGIKPIFGAELSLVDGHHVTVIAKDATGYAHLCRLISDAHLSNERRRPRTTMTALAELCEGLFVLSGCARSEVASLAAAGRIPQAVEAARRWHRAIGDGYRIEVFDHRGYGHRALRDRLLGVARAAGVPPVATNNVHYAIPEHAGVHEVLHAVRDIVPLSVTHALRNTSEYYLKSSPAMRELFDDAPEACDETLRIAAACDYDLDLDTYHFPEIPIPPGGTPTGLLAHRCFEGARRRYGRIERAVEDRLQHELNIIFKMGFAAYFLLVADIVDHVRSMGIRCACRGSAAGSLVCYVLGISDVDSVRYDLLFERFVNGRREELPDIDVDVESARREEVLGYILDNYGSDQTAICCMVDTFRARMAIRDVGKALGLPAEEIDTVATAFPHIAARDITAAVERLPELAGTNLRAGQLEQLFELCSAVDGFPRHLALHPSGVILSSPDLADRVPMQESFNGFTMLQADKHDVEDLGLVKLDVLGVRMLSSIAHAAGEIERTDGRRLDLDSLPHDDAATFDLIRSSRTLGCFQIESPGQRELLARLQPDRFEDLIVDISLFRPGPVQADMVGPYLQRRHGFEPVRYPHPKLVPILKETNGVIVFHEQVIRVIAAATGCSLDDADFVRRHLDSERPSRPDDPDSRPARRGVDGPRSGVPLENEVGDWFVERAVANGFSPSEARELWREVFAFASFGFCKSHAAAFALPTYISAYLKAHHTAAFLAGVLTHDPGMYPRRLIVADARNFGIPIFPVDVNRSDAPYRIESVGESTGIRLALSDVRAISAAEVDSILEARRDHPFSSLEDLWRRTELSQPVLENLVHAGALDTIANGRSRRELLWTIAELASTPIEMNWPRRRRVRIPIPPSARWNPNSALGGAMPRRGYRSRRSRVEVGEQLTFSFDEKIAAGLPDLPKYTSLEEVEAELEITGIDGSHHVMELYRDLLAEIGCRSASDLIAARNRSQVWVAGAKVASQTPAIRSGQRIIFVTLDDPTGPVDVTVFERVQDRCARTVFHSWLLLIRGELRKRGGASLFHKTHPTNTGITVVVEDAFDLAELARDRAGGMALEDALEVQRARWTRAGEGRSEAGVPRSVLWHASGGSAGR